MSKQLVNKIKRWYLTRLLTLCNWLMRDFIGSYDRESINELTSIKNDIIRELKELNDK